MPYLSKAQRSREKWITLKEAVAHIQRVENVDEHSALQQLRHALSEGVVGASWPMSEEVLQESGDSPTNGIEITRESAREWFWLNTLIDMELGTIQFRPRAQDKSSDARRPQLRPWRDRRPIWVWKESILKYWPDKVSEGAVTRQPEASREELIEALTKIMKEVKDGDRKRPDMNALHRLVEELVKPKRAPKKKVFDVYRDEFPELQIPRGRPKRK